MAFKNLLLDETGQEISTKLTTIASKLTPISPDIKQELATAVTGSGTVSLVIDSTKSIIPITISAATTFTFDTSSTGMTSGNVYTFELKIVMPATVYALTFPASVTWLEEPDFSESDKSYIVVLRTYNAGTNWVANIGGKF